MVRFPERAKPLRSWVLLLRSRKLAGPTIKNGDEMAVELKILALGALLLLVHIFVATRFKTAQYGRKWNVGARDEALPPPNPMTGRTMRAQANFLETFPVAIVALLGVVLANRTSEATALGGWIWLGARVVYLPLYAAGVPVIRTIVFAISIVGLAMVLWPLLVG
jgi:uncharacterized MAPEG superfamily protein